MVEVVMDEFLASSESIDWMSAGVSEQAARLKAGSASVSATIERCFVFVRDEIKHSGDAGCERVTWRASDVLHHRTGYCYAKSHLLAALLRANGIPAGLCYQRLRVDDRGNGFCLHGLNAVRLGEHRWYRLDARGNKAGLGAAFSPPREFLPFSPQHVGERNLLGIYAEPLPVVLSALKAYQTCGELETHLPDLEREPGLDGPTWARSVRGEQ